MVSDSQNVPTQPFIWQQGEDAQISMVLRRGLPPALVDLTGYSLRMDITTGTNVILSINSDDFDGDLDEAGSEDNEVELSSNGLIRIVVPRRHSIDGVLSSHLGERLGYDIFVRDTNGLQRKIMQGTIVVQKSITKWI